MATRKNVSPGQARRERGDAVGFDSYAQSSKNPTTGELEKIGTDVTLTTLDGLHLAATLVVPEQALPHQVIVLVHGGGVTREEGGFFTRLAAGLGKAGIASLRFDLRGHGESGGKQEELTLAAILNDIRVALAHAREITSATIVNLLGASFAGGICGYYAAKCPAEVSKLVLLNPQFDYKKRTIDSQPYWSNDYLDQEAAQQLTEHGYIQFTPSLKHGRAIFNEVFWLRPDDVVGDIETPTLVVHGTKDTLVPIELTKAVLPRFGVTPTFVHIEGAQHGFAVHDDPQYLNPQSQAWQAFVIETVTEWLSRDA
jgi:pimeloyl-ACP methyl ester carboxylesterase